jgi:hypothetical protein
MKAFKNVKPDEFVYILDPKPTEINQVVGIDFARDPSKYIKHQILECKVIHSRPHPQSKREQVWVLKIYLPNRLSKIMTPEALAKAEELGIPNTTEYIYVPKDETMVTLLNIKPFPTLCATSKDQIELWMAKTK